MCNTNWDNSTNAEFRVLLCSHQNKENKNMTKEKFYKVTAMCGHVSRNKYIPISFAVKAESGKEAAAKARMFPRVKHNRKEAIINCVEITEKDYYELISLNDGDDYLKCTCIQEQRLIEGLEDRIIDLGRREKQKRDKEKALFKLRKFDQYKKSLLLETRYCY